MSHVSLPLELAPNYELLLAARETTDAIFLDVLAQLPNNGVVKLVAENIYCYPYTLVRLADHKSKSVREAVASHLNTPDNTLRVLTQDRAVRVRENALNNPVLIN